MNGQGLILERVAAFTATPIGFVVGAFIGGRMLEGQGAQDGVNILLAGFAGGVSTLFVTYGAMRMLPQGARRPTAIGIGVVSFVILAYLIENFVSERMRLARQFDAAYAQMPAYEMTMEYRHNPGRRPLSRLAFESPVREFRAIRPGGWLCTGTASREQDYALFRALEAAFEASGRAIDGVGKADGADGAACALVYITWRFESTAIDLCTDDRATLAGVEAASDAMVEHNQRTSSCSRPTRSGNDE